MSEGIEQVLRDRFSLVAVKELENKLRRHQLVSTEAIAEATAKTLRAVVSATKVSQLDELVGLIRTVGHHLQEAQPFEPVIGNVTRRILFLLREEAKALTSTLGAGTTRPPLQPHASVVQSLAALSVSMPTSPATSMHASMSDISVPATPSRSFSISDLVLPPMDHVLVSSPYGVQSPLQDGTDSPSLRMSDSMSSDDEPSQQTSQSAGSTASHAYQLKPLLIQAIQELLDEFDSVDTSIAKDARDHIHSGEVILTLGYSPTVQTFLRAAAKHRKFIAVVPESAPAFSGHEMARALASDGLSVLLVPDSNVYALMPRVSKVILGARCVLALSLIHI